MPNRDKWEFEYKSQDVADAARNKAQYHSEKALNWQAKAQQLEKQLRDRGISLEETHHTGGTKFQARMDAALANDYGDAHNRMKFHENKFEQYTEFEMALSRHPEDRVQLTVADIQFFFGPPAKSEEMF